MPGSAIVSDLLGYTSIACWLGAQFPQVLENLRRQSCEGLALPFLANWFLGDFSNLVGCILTHQLPFQRYLATYFVFIDSVLVVQYYYYSGAPKLPPTLGAPQSYPARTASTVASIRKGSVDRGASRYRTLSAVAANVAAAAALAAQQDDQAARHTRLESDLVLRPDGSGSLTSHIPLNHEDHEGVEIDSDDDNTRMLADSFHSEGGRDIGRKRVSWSIERHRTRATSMGRLSSMVPPYMVPSAAQVDDARRGSSLGRSNEALAEEHRADMATEGLPTNLTAANRRNSRAGKKSATMVFLSAWALFGVGTLVGTRRGLPLDTSMSIGKVLSPLGPSEGFNVRAPITVTAALAEKPPPIPNLTLEKASTFEGQDPPPSVPAPPSIEFHLNTSPSAERVLGRIFAWLCTTLYLTSRLPQIWKNYVRKSVKGLSMYLFVFAFLGNVFYVASILSSPNMYLPPPASTAFLKESIPYLLGSGGTLMFDITIVTQSFIYKPKHKKRLTRSRSNTANIEVGTDAEEERAGLLAGDSLTQHQSHSHLYSHSHLPSHPHSSGTDATAHDTVTRGRATQVTRSASR